MPIPTSARHPVPFTPPALLERNMALAQAGSEAISVIVRVPTHYERDGFSAAMVRGGVIYYSKQQIRDLYLAGATFLYEESEFERIHAELNDLWALVDELKRVELARTERYIEIMERQVALPPERRMKDEEVNAELEEIKPQLALPEKQKVRTTAIQQDITARYEPLQKAFADLAEQEVRRNWLCVEIYVNSWTGLGCVPDGNGRGGITRPEAEWLRGQIGEKAFDELGAFIMAMHSLDGDEEKNLASLIESSSAPIGSTLAESMAKSEAGPSTDGPSTPIPDTGSQETTASSSSSTKRSRKRTGQSGGSRTGKASSTSPSS